MEQWAPFGIFLARELKDELASLILETIIFSDLGSTCSVVELEDASVTIFLRHRSL